MGLISKVRFCATSPLQARACPPDRIGRGFAQSGTPAPDQTGKPPAASTDPTKDNQRKTDEFVEASQVINGPGGNPECVWLGRRVVRLMWRDDLDTAFRHLDLYDRFGCPGGHVSSPTVGVQPSGSGVVNAQPADQAKSLPAQAPAAAAAPAGPGTAMGAGTYEVGPDIVPGRYKTQGSGREGFFGSCYFQRSRNDSGEFDSIISNDFFQGPGSVTVKKGEFLKLTGDCEWAKQ